MQENRTLSNDELQRRFGYHKGSEQTIPGHQEIRRKFFGLALQLDELLPPGRAKAVLFTELETAAMWAHKALSDIDPVAWQI